MNLFVSNLSPETTESDLRTRFSEFGTVVSVKIPIDRETGLPRGFGFVEMGDALMGVDAIDNLDQSFLKNSIIAVKEAKPKTDGPGGNRPNSFQKNNRFGDNKGGSRFNNNKRSY